MSKRNRKFTLDTPAKDIPESTPRTLTWYHILLASLGICLIFLGTLFTTGDLLWGSGTDIHTYQYPHRDFAFTWLKEGIWPLWNPYIFSGVPFQTGVHPLSYPFTILGLIFSTGWEIKFTVLFHLTIALAFTVYFLRLFNIKAAPAFLGGCAYALGGFFVSHLYAGHIDIVISAAYLPVMMFFFEKSLRSRTLKWTLIAGLFMALSIMSGHYQIIYMVILLMGFTAMLRTLLGSNLPILPLSWKRLDKETPQWREPPQAGDNGTKESIALLANEVPWKTRLFEALYSLERLVIIGLISGALTLFQLLPMLQSSGMANRSVVKDLEFATSYGTPPLNALTFFAPDFFGGTEEMPFFGGWSGWEGQGYFGIIVLLLAVVTIALVSWRKQLPLLVVILLAILLSFGKYTPVFEAYFNIDPLIGRFRVPSRFVMLVAFVGSWLGAIGLHDYLAITKNRLSGAKSSLYITLATIIGIFALFIILLHNNTATPAGQQFAAKAVNSRLLAQLAGQSGNILLFMSSRLLLSLIFVTLTAITLAIGCHFPEKRRYLAWVLVVATAVDLFIYANPKITTAPQSKFGFDEKVVNYLNSHNTTYQRLMTSPGLRGVNNGEAHGLAHDGGYDTLIDARYNEFANLAMGYDKDRQLMLMTLFNYGPFWQTQGVAWFLSDHPLEKFPEKTQRNFSPFKQQAKIGKYYVYYNPDVLPRTFSSHLVEEVKNSETLYRRLTKERLTPDKVFWTEEDGAALPTELAAIGGNSQNDKVKITGLTPNEVLIEAEMATTGLVVMTDTPFPGWQAAIDGQKATIHSLNGGLHRGILTPAGHHQIRMYYRPAALVYSLAISISVLLLALVYILLCHYKKVPKFTENQQQ